MCFRGKKTRKYQTSLLTDFEQFSPRNYFCLSQTEKLKTTRRHVQPWQHEQTIWAPFKLRTCHLLSQIQDDKSLSPESATASAGFHEDKGCSKNTGSGMAVAMTQPLLSGSSWSSILRVLIRLFTVRLPLLQLSWEGGPKRKYWLQNGWKSFVSFLTHLNLTLEMRMAMDESELQWDCKCGMFAQVCSSKSSAREFTTI